MSILRNGLVLVSALIALAGGTARAQVTASAHEVNVQSNEPGYTVTVEFDVDSAGSVTNPKVVKTDTPVLNDFALSAVEAGRVNPQPLPAPGSEARHVSTDLFFPVEAYDSGKPLPAGAVLPRPVFQPSPAYPFEYRRKKITGGVWLSVTVDKSGMVSACKTLRASDPEFGPAAEQAVLHWKFKPATLDGQPIEATVNVPLSFQIGGESHGWKWLVAPTPSLEGFSVTTDVN